MAAAHVPSLLAGEGDSALALTGEGVRAIEPERGLVILYRPGQPSPCPACGAANWLVGRQSAECGQCSWACDLAPVELLDIEPVFDR